MEVHRVKGISPKNDMKNYEVYLKNLKGKNERHAKFLLAK